MHTKFELKEVNMDHNKYSKETYSYCSSNQLEIAT